IIHPFRFNVRYVNKSLSTSNGRRRVWLRLSIVYKCQLCLWEVILTEHCLELHHCQDLKSVKMCDPNHGNQQPPNQCGNPGGPIQCQVPMKGTGPIMGKDMVEGIVKGKDMVEAMDIVEVMVKGMDIVEGMVKATDIVESMVKGMDIVEAMVKGTNTDALSREFQQLLQQ
ncbi:hypothetical protein DPEC_G00047550, partial [Dallia pectoralis]